jgi:hypothetical protein
MEEELRRCIICTIPKPIAAFNKEHVIPDAIGGRVVIYHVCIDCNSNLGEQADHHLTDHLLILMFRSEHHIGGAPNPFPEGRLLDDPRQIVYTEVKDGVLVPKMRVQKLETDTPGIIQFTGGTKDQKAIRAAIDKTFKRNNLPPITDEEFNERLSETPIAGMTVDVPVDDFYYARALAKIAYEMTWRWLGNSYIDDELAPAIRHFIRYGESDSDCSFIQTCRLLTEDESAKIVVPTDHTIILEFSEKSITCTVSIANIFVSNFIMSHTPEAYALGFGAAYLTNNAVSGKVVEEQADSF